MFGRNGQEKMNYIIRDEKGKLQQEYWDILKGIGALCIVIGHCIMPIQNFVYLFHVPLFFFISGFMFSEDKYGDYPYDNIKGRMKSWVKYVVMYVVYILFHNIFLRLDMLRIDESAYSPSQMVEQMAYAVIGDGDELLAGPLWFVPVLVIGSGVMGFIICLSRKIEKKTGRVLHKIIFQLLIICSLTTVGYLMILYGWDLAAHMQIALAVQLYFWIGYLMRNYVKDFEKYIKLWVSIVAFVILAIYSQSHLYSLVDGLVDPMMYVMSFVGFYFCMSLAKIICQVKHPKIVKKLFVSMGQASFLLMGTHFVIIRGIDRVYAGYMKDLSMMYDYYLGNHNCLIPLYLLLGIGIPLVLRGIWKGGVKCWIAK